MVTQAVVVSLRFWITKRPFQSLKGPSRLLTKGRYRRWEPAPTVTESPAIRKASPRKTSLASRAATGWSVVMTAEPLKPEGSDGLSRVKKVQPLPGAREGQTPGGGQGSRPGKTPVS